MQTPLECSVETPVRLAFGGNLVAVAMLVPDQGTDARIVLKRVLI